jgi:hypothetical protein
MGRLPGNRKYVKSEWRRRRIVAGGKCRGLLGGYLFAVFRFQC